MKIRFFEEVCGTMGTYGYGEMTVSKWYENEYGKMESFNRNELFAKMFDSMHPLSKKGVVLIDNTAFYVRNLDGIELIGTDGADSFLKGQKILYEEKK